MDATARLAAFAVQGAVPPEVDRHARRLLLDHLAAVVAGAGTPAARAVLDYVRTIDGGAESTVVGHGLRLSPPGAALVNGTAAHGLEVDDGYTPGSVHPSAATLPAVLAAAEALDATGPELAAAVAVAVEASCRLAAALHPASRGRGFHNTPVAGVLGAACGVARLHRLDPATAASALGVAASHAGGLFAFLGSGAEVKRLHAGKAARDGLIAVELARRGLDGPAAVLEDPNGYLRAFGGEEADPAAAVAGLGERWAALGTYVKPYPCCRHLHGAIDAIRRLREDGELGDGADVDAVLVETNATAAAHDGVEVATLLDAQMSLPHAVAAALVRDRLDLAAFEAPARDDEGLRALARRVEVRVDPELDAAYPAARPTRVTVRLADGRAPAALVASPLGEPDAPVGDAELEAKVRDLCEPALGAAGCEALIGLAWSLERPRELYALLRDGGA